jgi:hypothetical protein
MTIRGNITKTKYNNPEKQNIKLHSRETKHKITLQGNKTPAKNYKLPSMYTKQQK